MGRRRASGEGRTDGRVSLRRFRWVLGTPYFVQGTTALVDVPILYFIKFTLGMGDAGGQLFNSLRNAGWFVKPVWGLISDRFPLFGYRRKSWFVLMACLAVLFWVAIAALAYAGVQVPAVYLLTFNLAFATYAFVDVVCDALMVEHGRRTGRVGSFVNFQWMVLAVSNAGAVFLGGWLQERVQSGAFPLWAIFLATGVPPMLTAWVGLRNIKERRVVRRRKPRREGLRWAHLAAATAKLPGRLRELAHANRTMVYLVLFLFFWKFTPSIGFIERSYLIDVRQFSPVSFGVILAVGGLTFLASILCYGAVTRHFPSIAWHQYLYAMVAIGAASFPLSFYLYLDPAHPWWDPLLWAFSRLPNPFPEWNRYEWLRLIVQTVLGFATIPAFMIPLTIAGETVRLKNAGVSYAFLMSFTNVTDLFEGVVGAGLYALLSSPAMAWLLQAFEGSFLEIANSTDERTLILEIFVYIGLLFTLLTLPFVALLRRELARRGIVIRLNRPETSQKEGP